MNNEQLGYIIKSRIKEYQNDIKAVQESYDKNDDQRIKQDMVIIQELVKILSGKNLNMLSYID